MFQIRIYYFYKNEQGNQLRVNFVDRIFSRRHQEMLPTNEHFTK